MSKVAIVGGGAAGMAAAIAAARCGHDVSVIEKNEKLGKKVFITGKGRCNVTNAGDAQDFFNHVNGNSRFLYSAFYSYDNDAVQRFFEEAGCHLKIERGNRVFPTSDHSSDVIKALKTEMEGLHVKVLFSQGIKDIWIEESQDKKAIKGIIRKDGKREAFDALIIATGGKSYPLTGSTGDGYRFAKNVGHTVTELKPALVPLEVRETWCKELQGLSLKNVTATLEINGKKVFSQLGEMLFTHFGVSGPLVLSASSILVRKSKDGTGILFIDLKPALSTEQLDKRFLREFDENKNKKLRNVLPAIYPSKLAALIPQIVGIEEEKQINEITKEERNRLVEITKSLPLTILSTRDFDEAIITSGGISLKEINPSTMESKLVKNLYFAGEILDLDATTGGYNLQIAWSTGNLAGSSIN